MREIKIRPMLPSDFQHVGPLYREMVTELKQGYPNFDDMDAEVEEFIFFGMRMLKQNPAFGAFVAVDGKVAKGFAISNIIQRVVGKPKVYALGEVLFVTKNFRHGGVGEKLVRSMCEWAVANGAGALEVAFKPGTEAHKNWARMGFRSYSTVAVLADREMKPILDYPSFRGEPAPKVAEG